MQEARQGIEICEQNVMRPNAKKGAVIGALIGLIALAGVLAATLQCLPFQISSPEQPWPWHCSEPAYGVIGYLAFPVNLLTNNLSRAILLAPISLLMYAMLGTLIGSGFDTSAHSRQEDKER